MHECLSQSYAVFEAAQDTPDSSPVRLALAIALEDSKVETVGPITSNTLIFTCPLPGCFNRKKTVNWSNKQTGESGSYTLPGANDCERDYRAV